ncbi:14-3-3 protein, partial [Teratosphaeria destructans]
MAILPPMDSALIPTLISVHAIVLALAVHLADIVVVVVVVVDAARCIYPGGEDRRLSGIAAPSSRRPTHDGRALGRPRPDTTPPPSRRRERASPSSGGQVIIRSTDTDVARSHHHRPRDRVGQTAESMAVSQIEYKILGRLAQQTAPSNHILSQALYQLLGLSIQLNPRLIKASRVRKLDLTRDTRSLQLYHHMIWLAREGLSITEGYILPYCQNGESGPECRVMAAKLRASLYHVFCLFHNHPPITSISPRSGGTGSSSSPSAADAHRRKNGRTYRSPDWSPREGRETKGSRRRGGKSGLRDPIPSTTSEASYITNPYATAVVTPPTPPPPGPPPPLPADARRTPTRPPGLAPIDISPMRAAASYLLPPLNYVPMAREHFETAQHLADRLLSATHALRLCVSLDHAMFLSECEKDHDRARRLAKRTIRGVYASPEGLDDDEFADAAVLVQVLGGLVK